MAHPAFDKGAQFGVGLQNGGAPGAVIAAVKARSDGKGVWRLDRPLKGDFKASFKSGAQTVQ